jgi:hypothetical protein
VCLAYYLRWQVELLLKEWKSYANLRAFDTANPDIVEGLIWASIIAAALKGFQFIRLMSTSGYGGGKVSR